MLTMDKKSDRIQIKMDPATKECVRTQAEKMDISMSKYIVMAIREYQIKQPAYKPQRYNQ